MQHVIHKSGRAIFWDTKGLKTLRINGSIPVDTHVAQVRSAYDPIFWVGKFLPPGSRQLPIEYDGVVVGHTPSVQKPSVSVTAFSPGVSVDKIQIALNAGDVVLLPGEYRFDRVLRLVPNRTIRGYGAVITGGSSEYRHHILRVADNVSLQGLEFRVKDYVFFGNDGRGIDVADCRLVNCSLGHWNGSRKNLWIEGCEFVDASMGYIMEGMYLRCRASGINPILHACPIWGGQNLAIMDCTFDGTDRGLVFASNWGEISNVLVSGVKILNCTGIDGGCEAITAEGGGTGVTDSLFLHCRIAGCDSGFNIWDAPFHRNQIFNLRMDDGDVTFGQKPASNNTFTCCEVRRGRVVLNDDCIDNVFDKCGFVGSAASRRASAVADAAVYREDYVIRAKEGTRNRVSGCNFVSLPPGVLPTKGTDNATDPVSPSS